MTRIRTVDPEQATGLLARLYREAVGRAGKIFNILRCQSVRPEWARPAYSR